MSKKGPIFIREIKKDSVKRRQRKRIDVDAKKAYAFVNEKAKRRENSIHTLAGVCSKVAQLSEKCESMILESWPVRKVSDLVADTWPVRVTRRLGDLVQRVASLKKE